MSAFDFDNCGKKNALKDECLIAFKVYDFFRIQECLNFDNLGYARAAETTTSCGGAPITEGDVITPPANATSVTINNLEVASANVLNKKKNSFRKGYYDVDIQFIFTYDLVFLDQTGMTLCSVPATNSFSTKISLFGSIDTDVTLSTDLFGGFGCQTGFTMNANPFIWVESKAVALAADLVYPCCASDGDDPTAVQPTIGLFAIIKLFRIVNLSVASKGFCIPEEIGDISSIDPCDYFNNLDFPMDSFAPPQRPEFEAGISSNIPAENNTAGDSSNSGCGCGCVSNSGCGCGCGR